MLHSDIINLKLCILSYKKISDYEDKTNAKIYNFITNVIHLSTRIFCITNVEEHKDQFKAKRN